MSGDGGYNQRKQDDYEDDQETNYVDDTDSPLPRYARPTSTQRPMTARSRRRPQIDEDDPPGAVGGEGYTHTRTLTERERVGNQAQLLLERFIMDCSERENLSSRFRSVIEDNVCQDIRDEKRRQSQHNQDDYLEDVSLALRNIGDQLVHDYELNRLIDMVPIQSPKEIFMKVCKQMFEDKFNWGRVVALFYFAYRLIVKAIVRSTESVPWIKEIFSWVLDFFYMYVVNWIVQRGGWKMIQEYWGSSTRSLIGIGAAAVLTMCFALWKQNK